MTTCPFGTRYRFPRLFPVRITCPYKLPVILLFGSLIAGCANPAYFKRDAQFVPKNWSRIAVLPFSGDPRFTSTATDTFALHLLEQRGFAILEPKSIQVAIDKVVAWQDTPNDITVIQAQRIGELVNADAVVIGIITAYNNGVTLNAFATAKLIDTRTGRVIAASHKPSGLLFGWSEHQAAMAAVERVARDMLKTLDELTQKNILSKSYGLQENGDRQPKADLL